MRDLIRAAAEVQAELDKTRWKYCFIGGVAVQKWGQVRVTQDIDLVVFTGIGGEEKFIDRLLKLFSPRDPNAREFALLNRTVLLRTRTGIDLDISCGAFSFEESAVARARKVQLRKGTRLKLCTPEDLIVYKAFADRGRDWSDIEGVIAKQGPRKLDQAYIFEQLKPLVELKEEAEIIPKLRELFREIDEDG